MSEGLIAHFEVYDIRAICGWDEDKVERFILAHGEQIVEKMDQAGCDMINELYREFEGGE